jgi:hypothetical protein
MTKTKTIHFNAGYGILCGVPYDKRKNQPNPTTTSDSAEITCKRCQVMLQQELAFMGDKK